jgi:hypothetical protein
MSTQMHINRLPLCEDVHEIIKSYLFYDMKTAETMKHIKNKKKEIVSKFENAAVSRKNDEFHEFEPESSDQESEHWALWLGGDENQFQADNCRMCGNYRAEHAYDYIPQNILCTCGYFEEEDDEDDNYFNLNQEQEDYPQDNYESDIDHYEYHEQYYNDSDLEEEFDPEQELEEQEARITRARIQYIQERQEQEQKD